MRKSLKSTGFVLSRKNHGEADRIIVLLTENQGVIKLLAKGVRKPSSRKRGHLEVFNKIRFSAVTYHDQFILTEAEMIESFDEVRGDVRKALMMYYFCEVVIKISVLQERQDAIYDIFEKYSKTLLSANATKKLRFEYVRDVLVETGYWPSDKNLVDPDNLLESVTERRINTRRIGKKMLE